MAGLPTNSNVLERQRLEQQRQEQQRIDALKHFGQLFKQRQIRTLCGCPRPLAAGAATGVPRQ